MVGMNAPRSSIGRTGDSPPMKVLGTTESRSALTVYGRHESAPEQHRPDRRQPADEGARHGKEPERADRLRSA
jgi:hypothetical protein